MLRKNLRQMKIKLIILILRWKMSTVEIFYIKLIFLIVSER